MGPERPAPAAAVAHRTLNARRYRHPMLARRRLVLVGAVVALVVGAAACSNRRSSVEKNPRTGSATASSVNGVDELTISAGSDYRFHPSTVTVGPGRLRIVLHNTEKPGQGAPHNLQVGGLSAASVPLAAAGQTRQLTFTAPTPGRYRFVCTIHQAQGQTGTLVVTGS